MAQPFSTRDDLKKDPLQDYVRLGLDWIAANRQTFLSIVGTAAIAVVVGAFIFANFRNLRKQAWERYAAGQNWLYANNPDNAMNFFNEVITNYSRTPAATYSTLSKADVLYHQRKLAEAIDAYKQCLARNPDKMVKPFVLAGLAAAQEDAGNYAEAVEAAKQFSADFPDHMLAPKMYESLARCYELQRNPDAAKETYEKIITMFPQTYWSEKARLRYQALAPQPFQTEPGKPEVPAGGK